MPISSVKRMWSRRDWQDTREGETFTDGYDVVMSLDPGEHPIGLIRLSGDIPGRGLVHDEVPGFWVKSRVGNAAGAPNRWQVVCTYGNSQALQDATDPTLEPPEIVYGGEPFEEEADTDADDNPIVNVNNEPFSPSIVRPFTELRVDYRANIPATLISVPWLLSYGNRVNSDAWPGVCGIGEALIDGTPEARYRYATDDVPAYYEVALRFRFREAYTTPGAPANSAWHRRVLNRGFAYIDAEGDLVSAKGADGVPYNQPVLLDASGEITTTPHWLYFADYKTANFAALFSAIGLVLP